MDSNAGRGKGVSKGKGGGRSKGSGDEVLSITRNVNEETNNDGNNLDVGVTQENDGRQENDENHAVTPENDVGTQENDGEGSSSGKKLLEPMSLWFEDGEVVRGITSCFQSYYVFPWKSWTEVDQDTKYQWFRIFKRSFTWQQELYVTVQKGFEKKGAERLKGMHSWLISDKPRKKGKVCPPWMHKDVHELLKKRSEDPAFIIRSERAKKNKRGGSTGSIHPGHVQGSVSTHAIARRMASKDGKLPSAADVYLKTHTKKDPVKGQVPCSEKPKKVLEEYEKKLMEYKEKELPKIPMRCIWKWWVGERED